MLSCKQPGRPRRPGVRLSWRLSEEADALAASKLLASMWAEQAARAAETAHAKAEAAAEGVGEGDAEGVWTGLPDEMVAWVSGLRRVAPLGGVNLESWIP